ncbi:MAG: AmmeMemoRadiSam system protein B [Anaerolineales bacterium]
MGEHVKYADIRPSPIAGRWYSDQPQVLSESIEAWLQDAQIEPLDGQPVGVVVPHAGHRYSGPVAAHAFAYLKGLRPEIVAVISPLHSPYTAKIVATAHDAYRTPLGVVGVELDLLQQVEDELQEQADLQIARLRKDQEHSLEIELPFLQVVLGSSFKLLPIMLRDQSQSTARALAQALSKTLQAKDALLVASSDLSHFYPQEVAERLDGELLRRVEALDPQAVLDAETQGVGFACGRGAIAALLWTAQSMGADKAHIVGYATSGDVTLDFDSVVGYGAVVVTRSTS